MVNSFRHSTGVVEILVAPDISTNPNYATCGTCDRTWDDSVATSWTPAPSGRCPFEDEHGLAGEDDEAELSTPSLDQRIDQLLDVLEPLSVGHGHVDELEWDEVIAVLELCKRALDLTTRN